MDVLKTSEVIQRLRERLAPVERAEALIDTVEGQRPHARRAAVLVTLFERQGELQLVFIRRASSLRAHSGEIAFAGGKAEPSDVSLLMTALREAQEEIGLDPARVQVLGVLAPVFTVVSNYLITPVVAYLPQGPGPLRIQESEVTELLFASLQSLADPAIARTEQWTRGGSTRTIYIYDYGDYRIWGATGRIVASLLATIDATDAQKGA